MIRRLLAVGALAGVLAGGVLRLTGGAGAADAVWAASTALMLVPITTGTAVKTHIQLATMASALATGEYIATKTTAVVVSPL